MIPRAALCLLAALLAGCSSVRWNGAYAGVQTVSRHDRAPDRNAVSGYLNLIWNIGPRCSFQLEPIVPFAHPGEWAVRAAFDVRAF